MSSNNNNRLIDNAYIILDILPSLYDWAIEKGDLQKYVKLDDDKYFLLPL